MKRTLNIGIGKRNFIIDEDAYHKLNGYLSAFRKELGGAYGSDEVMDDLEMRIADIFTENLAGSGNVVDIRLVEAVILQLGMPNGPYRENSTSEENNGRDWEWGYRADEPRRKLYRNPDDRFLFGVCGGLAGGVLGEPLPLDLLDVLQQVEVDPVGVVDVSVGVGDGDDLSAELGGLLGGVDRHVSGSGTAENMNRFRTNKNY